jgi:hypothetical protein
MSASSRDARTSPHDEELRRGGGHHRRFHGYETPRARRIRHRRVMPPVVVKIGELVGLIYRSEKGSPGVPRTYIHLMRQAPLLVSDLEGAQLYIVGGRYRFTERGIEESWPEDDQKTGGAR